MYPYRWSLFIKYKEIMERIKMIDKNISTSKFIYPGNIDG
jgi:hypothetical protein